MHRRGLLGGGLASLAAVGSASAAWNCGPYACEVGIPGLNVTPAQQCEQWCWAAALETIFAIRGFAIDQRVFVQNLFGDLACAPANDVQISSVASGYGVDANGRAFRSRTQLIYDPALGVLAPNALDLLIQDLANGYPVMNGALGHATVITGMSYNRTPMGNVVTSVVARDPWPLNPNRRILSAQEVFGASFVMRVEVVPA